MITISAAILVSFLIITALEFTTFSNALSEENITFTTNENITRNISVLRQFNFTNAVFNVSGFIDSFWNNLSAYYKLDESSGIAIDSANGFNNLTNLTNVSQGANGILNTAYYFNGSNTLTNNFIFNSTPRLSENGTISIWVNYNDTSSGAAQYILGIAGAGKFDISMGNFPGNGTRVMRWRADDGAGAPIETLFSREVFNQTWHNFIFTWNKSTMLMYQDNEFIGQNFSNMNDSVANMFNYKIGCDDGGNDCANATYDEISIFNRTFTAEDVSTMYNSANAKPLTDNFPSEINISINNTQIFNFTGIFDGFDNRTSNFASVLSIAINNGSCNCFGCEIVASGQNCTINISFHSDTDGVLEYSDINLTLREDLSPNITVVEPNSTFTSISNISLNFTIVDDFLLDTDSCVFNVTRGASTEIADTSVANCVNTTFTVSGDANYVLNLKGNDSFGNLRSVSSSFIVDTGGGPGPTGGGGGGAAPEPEVASFCGDAVCQTPNSFGINENFFTCPTDCPGADLDQLFDSFFGNCFDNLPESICFWSQGSGVGNQTAVCGDNVCQAPENSFSCTGDCGAINGQTLFTNCVDDDEFTPCFYNQNLFYYILFGGLAGALALSTIKIKSPSGKKQPIQKVLRARFKRRRKRR